MKITLLNPSSTVALGIAPAVESFSLTPRQLRAWNASHFKLGGISANENANEARGLPCPAARRWLRGLHEHVHGICYPTAPLTMADVRRALSS